MPNTDYQTPNTAEGTPSVYKRGATEGWKLGLYCVLTFVLMVRGMSSAGAGMASLLLLVLTPVPVFIWLRRDFLRYPATRFFSAIWMQGIAIFFFASLILALGVYIYLRFIEPDFMASAIHTAIEVYRSINDPNATIVADSLQNMVDKHMMPSSISIAVSMIWSTTFCGSMVSLVLALIVKAIGVPKSFQNPE